ncbi:hypothetical protein [Bradyrhizobium diazoefficiens]|uniref:hypothetical protein n=1 Tax=Bradyrhizobium diazoefficiens TaxID=1355477 RepID=UPI003F73F4B7
MTSLRRIEAHNSDRISVLARQQIPKNVFEAGVGFVSLAAGASGAGTEVVEDQIDNVVERHARRRETHTQTPRYGYQLLPPVGRSRWFHRAETLQPPTRLVDPTDTQVVPNYHVVVRRCFSAHDDPSHGGSSGIAAA